MVKYILILIVFSLHTTPVYADLMPLLFAGYEVEDGDFEGSSSAPLVGFGF